MLSSCQHVRGVINGVVFLLLANVMRFLQAGLLAYDDAYVLDATRDACV